MAGHEVATSNLGTKLKNETNKSRFGSIQVTPFLEYRDSSFPQRLPYKSKEGLYTALSYVSDPGFA